MLFSDLQHPKHDKHFFCKYNYELDFFVFEKFSFFDEEIVFKMDNDHICEEKTDFKTSRNNH